MNSYKKTLIIMLIATLATTQCFSPLGLRGRKLASSNEKKQQQQPVAGTAAQNNSNYNDSHAMCGMFTCGESGTEECPCDNNDQYNDGKDYHYNSPVGDNNDQHNDDLIYDSQCGMWTCGQSGTEECPCDNNNDNHFGGVSDDEGECVDETCKEHYAPAGNDDYQNDSNAMCGMYTCGESGTEECPCDNNNDHYNDGEDDHYYNPADIHYDDNNNNDLHNDSQCEMFTCGESGIEECPCDNNNDHHFGGVSDNEGECVDATCKEHYNPPAGDKQNDDHYFGYDNGHMNGDCLDTECKQHYGSSEHNDDNNSRVQELIKDAKLLLDEAMSLLN